MLMGVMIRWMSRGFDVQPTLGQCIGFAAYCASPWFFAGIIGLVPIRWLALIVLVAASAYATVLLYGGLQTFLRLRKEQAMLFATCVWGVGLLLLVTILVSMILFWTNGLMPEYVRPASLG
ncbi:MAG TPA: Yip1 family protein, partial [Pseudomonas sp.]|nr:Yip1 family protein [Pseudomonas sp.]